MIYSLHLKMIIRKFILTDQELIYDKQYLENMIK